eukprot:16429016-Heterocapsa_arctica.AAC.1
MLLQPPVQEVPGAGVSNFPPLPEPLRPTGTRQGQSPANRARIPVEGEEAARPPLEVQGSAGMAKGAGRRARPVSQ